MTLRQMRKALVLPLSLAAMAIPAVASAQTANPNCPPGSWFCGNTQEQPTPAGQPVQLQPLPPPNARPAPPPPVVVYQPPPPVIVYQPPPPRYQFAPPGYYYAAPPRQTWPIRSEWGVTARVEGAAIGGGYHGDAGLGGVGVGLRYKPTPWFGVEGDLDFYGGRDYNGFSRTETSATFNALLFLNPRSRAQVYLLAGFGWSGAHVNDDQYLSNGQSNDYTYFGGQAGIGMEFRLSRHFALSSDVRGFLRSRIDANASSNPEFVDPSTGQTTNTSAGALFTGGMTFYW